MLSIEELAFLKDVGVPSFCLLAIGYGANKAATYLAPLFERLVVANESTAKETAAHTISLNDIKAQSVSEIEQHGRLEVTANKTLTVVEEIRQDLRKGA